MAALKGPLTTHPTIALAAPGTGHLRLAVEPPAGALAVSHSGPLRDTEPGLSPWCHADICGAPQQAAACGYVDATGEPRGDSWGHPRLPGTALLGPSSART
jgi:hypothetical protein